MKQPTPDTAPPASTSSPHQRARAQTILLVAIFFVLGIAASAFWFYATSKPNPPSTGETTGPAPAIQLSESTRAVLRRLNSPLDVRFYDLLDSSTVPESTITFAARVGQLLAAYEQAGGALVKVTHVSALSVATQQAADRDGIQPFNQEKGESCYLGLVLVLKGRKETLPRLAPEWEPALEPDITRAIARLLDATQPIPPPAVASAVYTNAAQEVRALIPDPNAVSLEEGKRILQGAALKDFTAATKEMQTQLKAAEQRLSQAQASGSEADKQAALKNFQQVQAEQTEKLKEIAARSKAQLDAFERIKSAPH